MDDKYKFDAWSRAPKLVLWDNPERWGEEGGGRAVQGVETHVYLWPIRADVWQKKSQYFKVIILQLKQTNFKNKMKDFS